MTNIHLISVTADDTCAAGSENKSGAWILWDVRGLLSENKWIGWMEYGKKSIFYLSASACRDTYKSKYIVQLGGFGQSRILDYGKVEKC